MGQVSFRGQSPILSIENNLAVAMFFDFNTYNSPFFFLLLLVQNLFWQVLIMHFDKLP